MTEEQSKLTELHRELLELRDLLFKFDFLGQAATVEEIALLSDSDPDLFLQRLDGPEFWGGSGSVWDAVVPDGESRLRFRTVLLHVAEEVAAVRGTDGIAAGAARTLTKWRDLGVM